MVNYKVLVSYDGTRYKGWQRLGNGELTIQYVLEKAIESVIRYQAEIHGSGRTDAGVHATGQVFHMKVPFHLSDDFLLKVNESLPEDIRCLQMERVPGDFHARYSAAGKKYCYYVDIGEKSNVFRRKYVYHFPYELDLEAMRRAAESLLGTHDFSAFTDDKSTEKDKVRTIDEIQIQLLRKPYMDGKGDFRSGKGRIFVFMYRGDGFLQHMVRILTGTLLEVGQGKKNPEEIEKILAKKERAAAGFMVPAKGLFLEKVDYKKQIIKSRLEKVDYKK